MTTQATDFEHQFGREVAYHDLGRNTHEAHADPQRWAGQTDRYRAGYDEVWNARGTVAP